MEIGIFEAIPMQGSISLKELAETCKADESLISTLSPPHPQSLPILTETQPD